MFLLVLGLHHWHTTYTYTATPCALHPHHTHTPHARHRWKCTIKLSPPFILVCCIFSWNLNTSPVFGRPTMIDHLPSPLLLPKPRTQSMWHAVTCTIIPTCSDTARLYRHVWLYRHAVNQHAVTCTSILTCSDVHNHTNVQWHARSYQHALTWMHIIEHAYLA